MYFEDLSKYKYQNEYEGKVLNIGWLDCSHPYNQGATSDEFKKELFEVCRFPVNQMRGYHQCPFCKNAPFGLRITNGSEEILAGSAEIWVKGPDEVMFAAPDLIYHYVSVHNYAPPEEFVNSVCAIALGS